LNLRQILDLGHRFSTLSPTVKMKDVALSTNAEDARYLNAVFRLVSLKVPEPPPPEPEPEKDNKKGKK
jgi:hypothetical protein